MSFEIYTAWEDLGSVRDGIEAAGFKVQEAEVTMIPSTTVDLDLETAPKLLRLIDMLEDCDDVQNVYHNGILPRRRRIIKRSTQRGAPFLLLNDVRNFCKS